MSNQIRPSDITDSSTRVMAMINLAEAVGLSKDDMQILAFAFLGDVKDGSLLNILQKTHLPKGDISHYNKQKLVLFAKQIAKRMMKFDEYGVLNMNPDGRININKPEIIKLAKENKYFTVFGVKVLPVLYAGVLEIMARNPEYVLKTFVGIRDALNVILDFVEAKSNDDTTKLL